MTTETIISIVFRLINFGIIVGIVVYLFKRKLIPDVNEKIAAKHEAHQNLTKQNQQLLDQQRDLEKEIDQQEILGKNLYDQITVWSSAFEKQLKQQVQEQKERFEQVRQRMYVQTEQMTQAQIQRVVFSKALLGAQQELTKHFASEQAGRQFVSSVINNMREETP